MEADLDDHAGQGDDRINVADTLSVLIAQTGRAHRLLAGELLAKVGLHPGQEFLLFQLWEQDGLTQRELANRLGIEPPTVTKMLQRMEQTGLLRREPDPTDARVSRVYLTNHGRQQRREIERIWMVLESRTTAHLTAAEYVVLGNLLRKVRAGLTQP